MKDGTQFYLFTCQQIQNWPISLKHFTDRCRKLCKRPWPGLTRLRKTHILITLVQREQSCLNDWSSWNVTALRVYTRPLKCASFPNQRETKGCAPSRTEGEPSSWKGLGRRAFCGNASYLSLWSNFQGFLWLEVQDRENYFLLWVLSKAILTSQNLFQSNTEIANSLIIIYTHVGLH